MATKEKNLETQDISALITDEETVRIKLPMERGEAEDGLPVWVNNKRFLIKRGVQVDVPRSVYEIIKAQEEMMRVRYEYEKAHSN